MPTFSIGKVTNNISIKLAMPQIFIITWRMELQEDS